MAWVVDQISACGSVIGGGQIGYNWQKDSRVFGLEGDIQGSGEKGSTNLIGPQGVNTPPTFVPVAAAFGNSSTRVGWTIGAGIEGVISGNWTAKLEYLYIDLGNISGSFVTPVIAPSGNFVTASYNSHITDNVLRVGVNYRWAVRRSRSSDPEIHLVAKSPGNPGGFLFCVYGLSSMEAVAPAGVTPPFAASARRSRQQ
jgi:opacity protein-like surface antigen